MYANTQSNKIEPEKMEKLMLTAKWMWNANVASAQNKVYSTLVTEVLLELRSGGEQPDVNSKSWLQFMSI